MSRYIALKQFAAISLFYAVVFSFINSKELFFIAYVVCFGCSLSVYVAKRFVNIKCRFIGIVFLVPIAILGFNYGIYWQVLIPIIYTAGIIVMNRLDTFYWETQKEMKIALCIIIFFMSVCLLGSLKYFSTFVFAISFLLSAIILLRELRMGSSLNTKGKILNCLVVIGTIAGCLLLGTLVDFSIRNTASIGIWIFYPIAVLLKISVYVIAFIKEHLFFDFSIEDHPYHEPVEEELEDGLNKLSTSHNSFEASQAEVNAYTSIAQFAGIVLLIVLIAFFIFLLIRYINRAKDEYSNDELMEEANAKWHFFKKYSLKSKEKDNAQKVREIYKKYLRFLNKQGIFVMKKDTSMDVLMNAESLPFYEESIRLRDIYIRARYQDDKKILDADVNEAKELYKRIVENARRR